MDQIYSNLDNTLNERQVVAARALLDYVPTGLIALDGDRRILLANAAAQSMLGLDGLTTEFTAASCIRLDSAEQTRLTLLLQGKYEGPLRLKSRPGQSVFAALRADSDGTTLLSLMPSHESGLERISRDALTGLADRHGFHDRLTKLCAAPPGLGIALLLIDLDRFEPDDEDADASAGEALTKLVAQRLRTIFRDADVLGRLGEARFAVAIAALPEVPALAERLITMLGRPYLVEEQSAVIAARVGIAFAPQHGTDPDVLTRAATLALTQARADGSGSVRVFEDDLDLRSRTRHALAEDLRRAIPLRQLELHFQPLVTVGRRSLKGFEALIRWNHPKLGMLAPDRFIMLAEEMGLMLPLGEWVLHEACRQAKSWPDPLTVAVNISPKQLLDPERLPRTIAASLASSQLPPRRLEIEITEIALSRDPRPLEVLNAIRAMGVRVSLDDFGTGVSSLSQLRRFPFHKLKIDRSFISGIGQNAEADAAVRAIAALGKGLGITTVAEGVETVEQEAQCRTEGCTEMQGYLVSKAVPTALIPALIVTFGKR